MPGVRPVIFIRPICLPKTTHYFPLWRRQVEYPKVFPGDHPVPCFLPPFWMKMMYPGPKNPPNHVVFKVHPQMTKRDVQQYLEKIYNVPVVDVRVKMVYHDLTIRAVEPIDEPAFRSAQRLADSTQFPPKPERYEKVAYVRLVPGEVFVFPDLFKDKRPSDAVDILNGGDAAKSQEAISDDSKRVENNKLQPLKGCSKWFAS